MRRLWALVEFLARRTLVEVLKENTRWLTRKVNEKLPDGAVSEELIGKWLRDAFSDLAAPPRMIPLDAAVVPGGTSTQASVAVAETVAAHPAASTDEDESVSRRIGLTDLLDAGLLLSHDLLMVEGTEGRRQTATLTPDGKINVAGLLFDSVSPAALRAMELAGRPHKAVNGWATFRVLRDGNYLGTLLEVRGQYEDREQNGNESAAAPEAAHASSDGPDPAVLAAAEQLRPVLTLLPELSVSTSSKSAVSLYAGKLVIGYAFPRKRGLPRLRVFVGEFMPTWVTPDPTYAAWCFVDDWSADIERVVALMKESPKRRAEDLAAGRDAYRRRVHLPDGTSNQP